MAKSDGMLAIVWLLRSRERMTAQELAENLEISVRSVYRYMDALCASGVPIIAEAGHAGGYRLLPEYRGAPLFFSAEERAALAHSALFAQKAGYPFTDAMAGALRKIQYYSTQEQMDDLALHTVGLDVMPTADHSAYAGAIVGLERSVAYGRTVKIAYRKAREDHEVSREIDPYGLIHWRERWYVIAYCHLRQDVRTFRIDRIHDFALTDARFTRPQDFSASAFFTARQITATAETDALTLVLLAGDDDAMDDLGKHWLLGSRLVEKSRNEASFLVEEWVLMSYVPHLLLAYGRSVLIRSPDLLKRRMIELTAELSAYYQGLP